MIGVSDGADPYNDEAANIEFLHDNPARALSSDQVTLGAAADKFLRWTNVETCVASEAM